MEDFEYFEGWNKTVRWILFIPLLLITYTIVYFAGSFGLWYGLGWIGMNETSFLGIIIHGFLINFTCFFLSLTISVACAPKWKIVISSIYLGLLIFMLGFATLSVIAYGDPSGEPIWSVIYSYVLNLAAAITSLIVVISRERERNEETVSGTYFTG